MTDPFEQAAMLLPQQLRQAAQRLPAVQRQRAEEFRLRAGQFFSVTVAGSECIPDPTLVVSREDIQAALSLATRDSAHTVLEKLKQGYITVEGGHRIGICGSAVVKNGSVELIRHINSLCVRIARQAPGAATGIVDRLLHRGRLENTLIISPPGFGKTTLLRDLVRQLSYGTRDGQAFRVAVADERGEIAGCHHGAPQLDVGPQTDVMDGAPKGDAAMLLVRAMNPQVLALDEITAASDIAALHACAGCGISVVATAHASSREDLDRRHEYRDIVPYFKYLVTIEREPARRYRVEAL